MGAAGQALTASLAVTTSRASADLTRCRIPTALLDGAAYPGQLAEQLELSRSTVSNHLSCCLRGCGLVVATYQGRQVHDSLPDAHLACPP
jgi:DNA-binding transcriptional ArsR family regulator